MLTKVKRDYKQFFAICKKHDLDYKEAVNEFTEGRTNSLRSLSDGEYKELMLRLTGLNKTARSQVNEIYPERKKMRGKIIHYLSLLGYTDLNGKPDYTRIDQFIINIGSRNPRRVILNYLYPAELQAVLNQIEMMYKKELNA